jgi:hypothetical protein
LRVAILQQPDTIKAMCLNEIRFAAGYFANKLMGKRLSNNITLEISLLKMSGVADGYCNPLEYSRNPRTFEIVINANLPRFKQLQVLAHEMVHVKQYARNELQSQSVSSVKFAGKLFRVTESFEDYLEYPWEIEAFGREKGLYTLYQMLLEQERIKFRNGKMYIRGKYVKMKENM